MCICFSVFECWGCLYYVSASPCASVSELEHVFIPTGLLSCVNKELMNQLVACHVSWTLSILSLKGPLMLVMSALYST